MKTYIATVRLFLKAKNFDEAERKIRKYARKNYLKLLEVDLGEISKVTNPIA